MSKHTPLTWHLARELDREDRGMAEEDTDIVGDDRIEVPGSSYPRLVPTVVARMIEGDTEANAAFIKRACNSHAALLEALELRRMSDRFYESNVIDVALREEIESRCRKLGWKPENSRLFHDFIRNLADSAIAIATKE
jgi:hypothetical protein